MKGVVNGGVWVAMVWAVRVCANPWLKECNLHSMFPA